MEIKLLEAAAPDTIELLAHLIRGPIFNSALVPGSEAVGFYDGLEFDSVKPHVQIVTSTRQPESLYHFATELDAVSLGLDTDLIETSSEAMSVMQEELLRTYREDRRDGEVHPRLQELIDEWYATFSPDGLLGMSRKAINEALGYVYTEGLETQPMVRGAVALTPISPQRSSARLTIVLDDMPRKTGRWMVIGTVVDGLDVAAAISLLPRVDPRSRRSRPLDPAIIESATLICRPRPQETSP
jgi:cyclophilin family peptidyl-prolyl cis-trans isomerase